MSCLMVLAQEFCLRIATVTGSCWYTCRMSLRNAVFSSSLPCTSHLFSTSQPPVSMNLERANKTGQSRAQHKYKASFIAWWWKMQLLAIPIGHHRADLILKVLWKKNLYEILGEVSYHATRFTYTCKAIRLIITMWSKLTFCAWHYLVFQKTDISDQVTCQ